MQGVSALGDLGNLAARPPVRVPSVADRSKLTTTWPTLPQLFRKLADLLDHGLALDLGDHL